MLLSVQILRALAALLVLVFHVQYEVVSRLGFAHAPPIRFGAAGVDIFFVVSGFIMVWSTRGMAGQAGASLPFLARRAVRIVPLYWLTTTVFLAGVLVWPPTPTRELDLAHLAASYLFIPWPNALGDHAPFYGLGWTLNYEMFFYVIFAACLGFRQRMGVMLVTGALVVLVMVGRLAPSLPYVIQIWSNPIILEFVAGALVGLLRSGGVALPGAWRLVLVVLGCSLLMGTDALPGGTVLGNRLLFWGVPATLILAGTLLGPEPAVHGLVARLLVLLGDASYAIYLVHFLVLSFSRRALARWFDLQANGPLLYALSAIVLALAISVAVHLLVERPFHRFLLRRLGLHGRTVGDHRAV